MSILAFIQSQNKPNKCTLTQELGTASASCKLDSIIYWTYTDTLTESSVTKLLKSAVNMTTESTSHCSGWERRPRNASYFRILICLDCLKLLSSLNTKYMKNGSLSWYWCDNQCRFIHKTLIFSTFRTSAKGLTSKAIPTDVTRV